MEKIIEKIDRYNLFTNIIPGYIMLIFNIYYFKLPEINIFEQLIIAYFVGQTLSRLGSLLISKILLKLTKEKGESYDKYIIACEKDQKISTLLQERNLCRTFCTLFVICIIEILLCKVIPIFKISSNLLVILVLIILVIIYGCSFCKYNKYISNRVRIFSDKKTSK